MCMSRFADVFTAAAQGKTRVFVLAVLITGEAPRPEEIRRFVEVKPRLDFNALEPGREANDTIRADARQLGLTPEHGVRVRLTGPVPLSDEEFATLTDRVQLMTAVMMGGVLLTLWLALRSFKLIFAILVTLFVGLAITMGLGLLAVGVFNIISIAFIALFVGLGVDFGIQFAVRYRHERHYEERAGLRRWSRRAAASAFRWRWPPPPPPPASSPSCRPPIRAWPNWAWSPASA